MNWPDANRTSGADLSLRDVALFGELAVTAFHLAYEIRSLAFVICFFLFVGLMANAEDKLLRMPAGLDGLKSTFMSTLKEANYLKHGDGNKVMSLR